MTPQDARTIWVGTDDGLVQLTRDGGKTWTNLTVNIAGPPPGSCVSCVQASRHDAATAHATFDRHTFGDMTPWAYRTTDFGKTWRRVVGPETGVRGYAHVIREDALAPSFLFLGTELDLWIPADGGTSWVAFKGGNFPPVAVRDRHVQPREHEPLTNLETRFRLPRGRSCGPNVLTATTTLRS